MDLHLGNFGPEQVADDNVRNIADQVKGNVEIQMNQVFEMYKALIFRSQVVAGTNYLIKVQIGSNNCVHLLVFQPLPCENSTTQLERYQAGHTLHDPLNYFKKRKD